VSKPIKQLTLAANDISQGNIETEIGYYTDADSEIGLLSQSLHRMVEQFRVHAMSMEQGHMKTSIKLQIEELITNSDDMQEIFEGLATMFCEYFDVYKTTIVYINTEETIAFSNINPRQALIPQEAQSQLYDFLHIEKLEALLVDRNIVFLNSHTIKTQEVTFLEPQTKSAYFLPLRKEELYGYLILENSNVKMVLTEGTESSVTYIANILSEWLSHKKWGQEELHEELYEEISEKKDIKVDESDNSEEIVPTIISKLKYIDGLDVESALAGMGGLDEVYEKSVKLMARLLPETIKKMDRHLSEMSIKQFTTEVHGIKGVLRNIGAANLGNKAARLEKAALTNEMDYCTENYPDFKKLLVEFMEHLNGAIATEVSATKEQMGMETLIEALRTAKSATECFDTTQALEVLDSLSGFSYNEEIDGLLEKVMFALEEFNCEGALINIKKMEEILNET
jgi:HPt (histidine-containing phosphotransfer) domain-containing protein/HAMP domain-containing protein